MRVPTEYLSPDDFEKFANRIVEKIFEKRILSFGEGADGGIDGIDDTKRPSIVVQSKRYQPSTTPKVFLNTIRDELAKLKKTSQDNGWSNDFDYVVVTSVRLNQKTTREIRELKPEWIKTDQHIIDGESLRRFSEIEEYKEIFENYNLIGKDFEKIIKDFGKEVIELDNSYFFDTFDSRFVAVTSEMDSAYNILMENHVVFLTGDPGVGKTTASQYLGALFSMHKDIKTNVLIKSVNDITSVVKQFSERKAELSERMLIIFDDFVGRNVFNATESNLLHIKKIVSFSRNSGNLYLVFNSRTPILEEAQKQNIEFSQFIEDIEEKITIDISKISDIDKTKILKLTFDKYFTLAKEGGKSIIANNFKALLNDTNYMSIVCHKNYTPRLVEALVRESKVFQGNFFEKAMEFLNNPDRLYDELFSQLSRDEKLLLYLTASIYDQSPILYKFLESYCSVFYNEMILFDEFFDGLVGFWLKKNLIINSSEHTEKKEIEFRNPSVYDYLRVKVLRDSSFKNILEHRSRYLLPFYLLSNKSESGFEKYISDNNKFKSYLDRNRFLGNKLLSFLKKSDISTEDINMVKECLQGLSEISNGDSGLFFTFKKLPEVIEKICESENRCLQDTFIKEFLYSSYNQNLIVVGMDLEFSKLIELIEKIDKLMLDCVNDGLSQNNIVDLAEKETGVNVLQEIAKLVEQKIIDKIDDPFFANWYEIFDEFFSKSSLDPIDFVDPESERREIVDKIFDYYYEQILKDHFTLLPVLYESLDIDKIYEVAIQYIEIELEEYIYQTGFDEADLRDFEDEFYIEEQIREHEEQRIEKEIEQLTISGIMSKPLGF